MPKSLFITTMIINALVVAFVTCLMMVCVHGCSSGLRSPPNFSVYSEQCTLYEKIGIDTVSTNAIIPKIVQNPCAQQNIIAVLVETRVALNKYQINEIVKWAAATRDFVSIGMPFRDVKECVNAKIPELNESMGINFIVVSDIMRVLPDGEFAREDDYVLLIYSIDDLLRQVSKMRSQEITATALYLRTGRFRS